MPREEVEIARAAYARLAERDLEGFLGLVHPEVTFSSLILEAEGGDYRGHEGARRWWAALHDTLGHDARFALDHIEDHPDGVILKARFAATVRGAAVEQTFWQAVRATDGMAVWWGAFRTREEALEAVRSLAA